MCVSASPLGYILFSSYTDLVDTASFIPFGLCCNSKHDACTLQLGME